MSMWDEPAPDMEEGLMNYEEESDPPVGGSEQAGDGKGLAGGADGGADGTRHFGEDIGAALPPESLARLARCGAFGVVTAF